MTTATPPAARGRAVHRTVTGRLAPATSRVVAVLAAPVLLRQGRRLRRDIPVLPEASGPRHGVEGRGEPLRLLVLGESTAAGVGAATQAGGLAPALAAGLATRADRQVSWSVVGRTGTTARDARRLLVPQLDRRDHDAILVALGVNDLLRLRSRRVWRRDLAALLAALAGQLRPGGWVVVAGLPDLGRFPALPQPLRAVLALHARSLDSGSARVAARTPHAVHAPAPPLEGDDFFATDGFHPSDAGYARWARALAAGWPLG